MNIMQSFIEKIDWILVIRIFLAIIFVVMAIIFHDWLPALFGITILATGIVAHKTKSGCGYSDCR